MNNGLTNKTVHHTKMGEEINNKLNNAEILLIVITVKVTTLLLIKIVNMCKKGYQKHNKRVITRHNSESRM